MDAKLTLKLDEKAIDRAKLYAGRHGVSVSRMVEAYFLTLEEPLPGGAPLHGIRATLMAWHD